MGNRRGSKFFIEFVKGGNDMAQGARGRSAALIAGRNEKLLHRYYYHARLRQLKYDLVLYELGLEFDISVSTVMQIVEKHTGRLREILDAKYSRAQLKKKYPYFSWIERPTLLNKDVK